jgi:hypothetical protein
MIARVNVRNEPQPRDRRHARKLEEASEADQRRLSFEPYPEWPATNPE